MRGPWWRVGFLVGLFLGLVMVDMLLRATGTGPRTVLVNDPRPTQEWGIHR